MKQLLNSNTKDSFLSSIVEGHEIDTPEQIKEGERTPYNDERNLKNTKAEVEL